MRFRKRLYMYTNSYLSEKDTRLRQEPAQGLSYATAVEE